MNTCNRVRRILPIGLALMALFFVNGALQAAGPCPEDDEKVIRIEISIDYEAGTVSVDKESVTVYRSVGPNRPNRICWVADDLRSTDKLYFDNKESNDRKYFRRMKRKMRNPPGFVNSGNPSKVGTWRYGITVKDSDGETVGYLDPEVIIKGD